MFLGGTYENGAARPVKVLSDKTAWGLDAPDVGIYLFFVLFLSRFHWEYQDLPREGGGHNPYPLSGSKLVKFLGIKKSGFWIILECFSFGG